ncbi:DUF4082 domain-containing protein [Deinococcus radiopugnans]|uniref:Uncharacterized protein n=1 Tax=Deinococcus radiopugnans ATCC 19172 TaxID=585398 RepID=A0A5C4YA19_9DEIO|nr:DUF4082 domain-containing protein [Deinococcus radiopugnans]MBB6016815.1 hypothetical protein [Deinococcus radiopugnans ATCC 19172]TNM71896.1 hypothetical protein FHR04_05885 [Deinococcus radiopugnans ATCC 19172]
MIPLRKTPGAGTSLPAGGTSGQVLAQTNSGLAWVDAPTEGVVPRLSAQPAGNAALPRSGVITPTIFQFNNVAWEFTPTADITITGVDYLAGPSGSSEADVAFYIWDVETRVNLPISGNVAIASNNYRVIFDTPIALTAGKKYRINEQTTSANSRTSSTQPIFTGMPYDTATLYMSSRIDGRYPNEPISTADYGYPPFDLLIQVPANPKGVIGPLDPADMPHVSDLALLPNGGQALYTGVTPPRPVYRAPDGTLYYGPAYSHQP